LIYDKTYIKKGGSRTVLIEIPEVSNNDVTKKDMMNRISSPFICLVKYLD